MAIPFRFVLTGVTLLVRGGILAACNSGDTAGTAGTTTAVATPQATPSSGRHG